MLRKRGNSKGAPPTITGPMEVKHTSHAGFSSEIGGFEVPSSLKTSLMNVCEGEESAP